MTTTTRRWRAVLGAAGVLIAAAGCGGAADDPAGASDNPAGVVIAGVDGGRFEGSEPATPYSMPNITLTATNGQDFNLIKDTAYPVTLVFYGYSNCPDVCPLVLSDITAAILQVPESVRERTQLVFITTDPARDSPEVLREYLDRFNEDYVGLTGPLHTIVAAGDGMGVAITGRKRLPDGGYEVGHGAQVIGFSGNKAPVIWTQGTPVPAMASDIEKLAGQ